MHERCAVFADKNNRGQRGSERQEDYEAIIRSCCPRRCQAPLNAGAKVYLPKHFTLKTGGKKLFICFGCCCCCSSCCGGGGSCCCLAASSCCSKTPRRRPSPPAWLNDTADNPAMKGVSELVGSEQGYTLNVGPGRALAKAGCPLLLAPSSCGSSS